MSLFSSMQHILVTGASSGIGQACALLCNKLGANVIACGRNEASLREAQARCQAPERWHIAILDLCEAIDDVPRWISSLRKEYGQQGTYPPRRGASR